MLTLGQLAVCCCCEDVLMNKSKIILGLAVFALLLSLGWQVGACELANFELRDDMQDMASQAGLRVGLTSPTSDDDLRTAILRKAEKYDIALSPEQVTVERMGSGPTSTIYIAAEYRVQIYLPGYSFELHFTPESGKKPS